MTLELYFSRSTGSFPSKGCVGIESDWFDVGSLVVPDGELWVGPTFDSMREDGCVIELPKGTYRFSVRGMDFEGHRRIARARVCLEDCNAPIIGSAIGSIGVDGGLVAFCDIARYERTVLPEHFDQFLTGLQGASYDSPRAGCTSIRCPNGEIAVAFTESGLGDGQYITYSLRGDERLVGMEVEFLKPAHRET